MNKINRGIHFKGIFNCHKYSYKCADFNKIITNQNNFCGKENIR